MKYKLETKDSKEFIQHYNGPNLYGAVWEFQNFLKSNWKYTDQENEAWKVAANQLTYILIDHGIDMEKDFSQ